MFQYLDDDGQVQDMGSADVNEYLRRVMGRDFTAKDFRTWTGAVLAARASRAVAEFGSDTQAKKNILRAVGAVAGVLGNTRAGVPEVLHPSGNHRRVPRSVVTKALSERAGRRFASVHALSRFESAVLALLQRRLRHDAQRRTA